MLYQALLVRPSVLDGAPCLKKWHAALKAHPVVQRVVGGQSQMGTLNPYFVAFK